MRGRLVPVLLLAGSLLLASCRPGGVLVTFRPDDGARYSYRIEVASESVVEVPGDLPDTETDHVVLRADHHVLSHGQRGTRVEVRLHAADASPDEAPRTFVVTLDRSARLAAVELVENVPAEALGEIGLSEIFPAAAGAPPDRRLRPGERWEVDERVQLPGGTDGRLRGYGRVEELRVVDGTKAAVITASLTLVVRRARRTALAGTQTTTSRSIHTVADGAVLESRSETFGDFTVPLPSPDGLGDPVIARLTVKLEAISTRNA